MTGLVRGTLDRGQSAGRRGAPALGGGGTPESTCVLLAPLSVEAAAARLGAPRVRVERIGMGPAKARAAGGRLARLLDPLAPVAVLGFGGGLSASDRAGDLVVATELLDGSASSGSASVGPAAVSVPSVELDGRLAAQVAGALRAAVPSSVRTGPVVCTPRMAMASEQARLSATGGLACEMESFWLAPLISGRPFSVVRAIVDFPGRELWSPSTLTGGLVAFRRLMMAASALASVLGRAECR